MDLFLEIIYTLTESFVLFLFVIKVFDVSNLNYVKSAVVIILQVTVVTVFNLLDTFSASMLFYPAILIITALFYNRIIKQNNIPFFVLICIGAIFSLLCDLITISTAIAITNKDPSVIFSSTIYRTLGAFGSRILYLLLVVQWMSQYFKKVPVIFSQMNNKCKLLITLTLGIVSFLILSTVNLYGKVNQFDESVKWDILLISAGTIIFSCAIVWIIVKTVELYDKNMQHINQESLFHRQSAEFNNFNEKIKALGAQRRDLRQQVGCLYGLIQNNENEEAKEYILSKCNDINIGK